ncbi:unnamed protein product, partial [marine sediment metagenome]
MDTILLGTRKGLLTFSRRNGGWVRTGEDFLGVRATYACDDPR